MIHAEAYMKIQNLQLDDAGCPLNIRQGAVFTNTLKGLKNYGCFYELADVTIHA